MSYSLTDGVDADGLKQSEDIKAMIVYLLDRVNDNLTRNMINEIFQNGYTLANYFEVSQAIGDLIANKTITPITIQGDEVLKLNRNSDDAVKYLTFSLPLTVREKATNTAIRLMTRIRREKENNIEVVRADNGFKIIFTLFDGRTEFLKLSLFLTDEEQVETVKENFLKNPAKIYEQIIHSLTE